MWLGINKKGTPRFKWGNAERHSLVSKNVSSLFSVELQARYEIAVSKKNGKNTLEELYEWKEKLEPKQSSYSPEYEKFARFRQCVMGLFYFVFTIKSHLPAIC